MKKLLQRKEIGYILIAVLAICIIPYVNVLQTTQEDVINSLIHYYPLDSDAVDNGTFKFNISATGSPIHRLAIVSNGLIGDGTSANYYLNEGSFSNAQNITVIDAWINVSGGTGCFLQLKQDTNNKLSFCRNVHTGNYLEVGLKLASSWKFEITDSGGTLHDNQYHHIVLLMGTGGAKLYADGMQLTTYSVGSDAVTDQMTSAFDDILIGTGDSIMNGGIDNIAMYKDRYDDVDINISYNSGLGIDHNTFLTSNSTSTTTTSSGFPSTRIPSTNVTLQPTKFNNKVQNTIDAFFKFAYAFVFGWWL